MLTTHLDDAIGTINELISITQDDIAKIHIADHSQVQDHTNKKTALIKEFERSKRLLDAELVALNQQNAGRDLSEVLSDDIKDKLSSLREALTSLHALNKEYAKSVVVVREFFDTMIKNVFGTQSASYGAGRGSSGGYGGAAHGYGAGYGAGAGDLAAPSEQIFKIRI